MYIPERSTMASVQRGLFTGKWQPIFQFVRHRKVNVQKPFPPHFERAKVEHVCKPFFLNPKLKKLSMPLKDTCNGDRNLFKKGEVDNPYETLIARETLNWFNHSNLIAFFHYNPMNSDEMFEARLLLKKMQMKLKLHGRGLMSKAVTGTKYEAVLTLYQSSTVVAFGPEANVVGLLKFQKKVPKLILLGAVVEDRLMSRAELEYMAKLPDLQTARAGLVAVLNSAPQQLVSHLNHHQSQLVNNLQTYVDISKKDKPS